MFLSATTSTVSTPSYSPSETAGTIAKATPIFSIETAGSVANAPSSTFSCVA